MGEIAKDDGVSISEITPDGNVEFTVDTEVKLCCLQYTQKGVHKVTITFSQAGYHF